MKTLITTVAAIAIATPAFAGDLPSKAAPASAPVAAAKSSSDSYITVDTGYEADKSKYGFNDRKNNTYNFTFNHSFAGGFNAGFAAGTGQVYNHGHLDQTLEAQGGYSLPSILGVSLSGKVGVGEHFTYGKNYPYYAVYGNIYYKVGKNITFNAVQYRYRNAFDSANLFESHQIGTGMTYNVVGNHSVYGVLYRNLDNKYNPVDNGVTVGYKYDF